MNNMDTDIPTAHFDKDHYMNPHNVPEQQTKLDEIAEKWANECDDESICLPQNVWLARIESHIKSAMLEYAAAKDLEYASRLEAVVKEYGTKIADLQKDKERLDWLERIDSQKYMFNNWIGGGGTLRTAIDSAMRQETSK